MADRLTPEELAAIQARHEAARKKQEQLFKAVPNKLNLGTPAHHDRAALLRHVEALEQEVERLREALADAENCHRTSDQWRSHYQTKLARLVDWLETLDGHPLPNHIETILKEARNG